MKKVFTRDEVLTIIYIVGRDVLYNPSLQPGDLELLKEVGYRFSSVENNFGGYTKLVFVGIEQTKRGG